MEKKPFLVLVPGINHPAKRGHFPKGDRVIRHQTSHRLGWQGLDNKVEIVRAQLKLATGEALLEQREIHIHAHSMGCLLAVWALTLLEPEEREAVTKVVLIAPTSFRHRRELLSWRFLRLAGVRPFVVATIGMLPPFRGSKVPIGAQKRLFGHAHADGQLCRDSGWAFLQLLLGLYPHDLLVKLITDLGFARERIIVMGCSNDACIPPAQVRREAEAAGVTYQELNCPHCGGIAGFPY